MGQSRSARLTTSACRTPDGSYADRWSFTLASETAVQIDLTSNQFDAYLFVENSAGTVIAGDDDAGTGTNARIVRIFPAGAYVIYANTYDAGETGSYQLSVQSATNHPCLTHVGDVVLGQTVTGSLSSDDCSFSNGTYVDRWRFELAAATTVQIDMISTAFDAFLGLTDASENVVAFNNDGGTGTNARITQLLLPGTYTIWANSAVLATGAYSLSVQTAGGAALSPEGAIESVGEAREAEPLRIDGVKWSSSPLK